MLCGMVEMSVDFDFDLLSIWTNLPFFGRPPSVHRILGLQNSNITVLQESKGSPLIEIHPLKAETLLSMTLTIREYFVEKDR